MKRFAKSLSANDVGTTGSHMAGVLVPKSDRELLNFFPPLDASTINPSAWIDCRMPDGSPLRLRFVYYNNRLHIPGGTRNEYRITYLTKFLRDVGAKEGDLFEIAKEDGSSIYAIRVTSMSGTEPADDHDGPIRIKLRTGWREVH